MLVELYPTPSRLRSGRRLVHSQRPPCRRSQTAGCHHSHVSTWRRWRRRRRKRPPPQRRRRRQNAAMTVARVATLLSDRAATLSFMLGCASLSPHCRQLMHRADVHVFRMPQLFGYRANALAKCLLRARPRAAAPPHR